MDSIPWSSLGPTRTLGETSIEVSSMSDTRRTLVVTPAVPTRDVDDLDSGEGGAHDTTTNSPTVDPQRQGDQDGQNGRGSTFGEEADRLNLNGGEPEDTEPEQPEDRSKPGQIVGQDPNPTNAERNPNSEDSRNNLLTPGNTADDADAPSSGSPDNNGSGPGSGSSPNEPPFADPATTKPAGEPPSVRPTELSAGEDGAASPSSSSSSSKKVPAGAIAGAVVGGLVLIALIALLVVFLRRRKRRAHLAGSPKEEEPFVDSPTPAALPPQSTHPSTVTAPKAPMLVSTHEAVGVVGGGGGGGGSGGDRSVSPELQPRPASPALSDVVIVGGAGDHRVSLDDERSSPVVAESPARREVADSVPRLPLYERREDRDDGGAL